MEEPLLGFEEEQGYDDRERLSSYGYKLVPWLNWDEWNFVRESLFSSSPDSVVSALEKVAAWRSRGCLPVVIEVTTSIIEIQQKDPFFRDIRNDASHSDEMLAMLYCMAIMRLVNCAVEKTRKKTEVSIGVAADAIGIPRMLIDIRHEASHRDLPSLQLVRHGAIQALDWLKKYYWDPQKNAIPFQSGGIADIREEIKSKLCELAYCLRVRSSLTTKGKRSKQSPLLVGHNKFFSIMASKIHSTKSGDSKKQITKSLKSLVRLYSSFSSEVISLLLEFLLKASDSTYYVPKSNKIGPMRTLLDDWKTVITKLSNKEPELLLTLLKSVLDMIQIQETMRYGTGTEHQPLSEHGTVICEIQSLSSLFKWLVQNLKCLKPNDSATEIETSSQINVPKSILMELLRKCIVVSVPGNNQLKDSAFLLSQHLGKSHLMEKLNKLYFVALPNKDITDVKLSSTCPTNLLQLEEDIHQAAKKLELLKHQRQQDKSVKTADAEKRNSSRWVVAESWNSCPIGVLQSNVNSSGCLSLLDCKNDHLKVSTSSENQEHWEVKSRRKREAGSDPPQVIDYPSTKKMKETIDVCESQGNNASSLAGMKGGLMINGVWKEVAEDEFLAIESSIRILV